MNYLQERSTERELSISVGKNIDTFRISEELLVFNALFIHKLDNHNHQGVWL
jgi:hypothetical protein